MWDSLDNVISSVWHPHETFKCVTQMYLLPHLTWKPRHVVPLLKNLKYSYITFRIKGTSWLCHKNAHNELSASLSASFRLFPTIAALQTNLVSFPPQASAQAAQAPTFSCRQACKTQLKIFFSNKCWVRVTWGLSSLIQQSCAINAHLAFIQRHAFGSFFTCLPPQCAWLDHGTVPSSHVPIFLHPSW